MERHSQKDTRFPDETRKIPTDSASCRQSDNAPASPNTAVPELLAPAGDFSRLQAAIQYGADAVYLAGESFGMRSASKNFSAAELHKAVHYAHARGKKVYLACNAMLRNHQLDVLAPQVREWEACGIDAIIVGDMGALRIVKRTAPDLDVHISVQTGLANYEAVRAMADLGACRAILARELTLDEIAEIRAKTPSSMVLEAFVHGSMCVSVSGRCLLSDYMTLSGGDCAQPCPSDTSGLSFRSGNGGDCAQPCPSDTSGLSFRSGNGGDCAQPCRWKYALMEEKRPGEYFPVREDIEGSYILNAKDLCMLPYLPQMAAAGIGSLKIEGRAKSVYYTAVTTNAYRCALDEWRAAGFPPSFAPSPWITDELYKVSHRPYSTGFYLGGRGGQHSASGGYVRDYAVMGVVCEARGGRIYAQQRNKLCRGDQVEILEPGKPPLPLKIERLWDGEDHEIDSTPHPTMPFSFPCDRTISAGALIRRARTD